MKLVCPCCGAIASADTWLNDELAREALQAVACLPAPLPKASLGYISMFRPGSNGLTWKKALRLISEISAIASMGYIHIQGKIDRSCPPSLLARAMEQMVEQRTSLILPLKNHNYLLKVAWQLADQADAAAERAGKTPSGRSNDVLPKRISETSGLQHIGESMVNPMDQYIAGDRDDRPTDEEMAEWNRKRMQ